MIIADATQEFETEIKKGFLSETLEMLEDTEAAFLSLEKNPGDIQIIEKIFRLAHTIKGSAQSAKFFELATFAHGLESLLVNIREAKVKVTPEVIDTLLLSNDMLKHFVARLQEDLDAKVDTAALSARIQSHVGGPEPKNTRDTGGLIPEHKKASGEARGEARTNILQDQDIVWAEDLDLALHRPAHKGKDIALLLCDDDRIFLNLMRESFQGEVARVFATSTVEEAIAVLEKEKVDVIIADIVLPGRQGTELARIVAQRDRNIPVIFISGDRRKEAEISKMNLRMYDFVSKPFEFGQLMRMVHNAWMLRRLKDSVMKMSGLNFRVYMLNKQIRHLSVNSADKEVFARTLGKLESHLSEMHQISEKILE